MVDRVGQHLGNYRLIRLLGKGGFAEVYLGEHNELGTQAAIKILQTALLEEENEKFRTEARTIANLIHPHIIRVFDYGVFEESTPFMVMDYAPGGTLKDRRSTGARLPLPTIVSYVKQVADALQFAHDTKIIHRDIKPANMLVGRDNEILLSDFGIAVIAHSTHSMILQNQAGTIAYMAPEQLQGNPTVASDQYALGIVVYEWLCGEVPFQGTVLEILSQHLSRQPPPLHAKIPTIFPSVEQTVLKALEKAPQQRFASVKEFANALEQAQAPASLVNIASFPLSSSLEVTAPVISRIETLPQNEPITLPNEQSRASDPAALHREETTAKSKVKVPNLDQPTSRFRGIFTRSSRSQNSTSMYPLLERIPRGIWRGHLPLGMLWFKLIQVSVPVGLFFIAFLFYAFTRNQNISGWGLFAESIPAWCVGYGFGIYTIVALSLCSVDYGNRAILVFLGFAGTALGAGAFFGPLVAVRNVSFLPVAGILVGLAYLLEPAASLLLYREHESSLSLSSTFVPFWEWIQYLGPAVLLHLLVVLWAVHITGVWKVADVAIVALAISGIWFVVHGTRNGYFPEEDITFARISLTLDVLALLIGLGLVVFVPARDDSMILWAIGLTAFLGLSSSSLIPAHWYQF